MTEQEVAAWLETEWSRILETNPIEPDPEVDQFVNSTTVSIRYAFLTQLLGKMAQPKRDLLCIQKGADATDDRSWDARGFCARLIVPWVQRTDDVLGTSPDPYVNNPLRRPRLDYDMAKLRPQDTWASLVSFLDKLERSDDPELIRKTVHRCLCSLARRLSDQEISYPVPQRISLNGLCDATTQFLASPSRGLRPMIFATALLRVVGRTLDLFSDVSSRGLNESDAATGAPGDIVCSKEDQALLAVEVKEQPLRLAELRSGIGKARQAGLRNYLFLTPGVVQADATDIAGAIDAEWAQGTNIYHAAIPDVVRVAFMLVDEGDRRELLVEVGRELDARGAPMIHRQAWADLLT